MQLVIMSLKSPLIQSSSPALFCFVKLTFFFFVFLVELGLGCSARAFSSCGEQGLLSSRAAPAPPAVASLVEHRLGARLQ